MAQFQLYQNKDKHSSSVYPFFIDAQNDLFNALNTRMVIPLTPLTQLDSLAPNKLCPTIHLPDGDFVILTQQMTSVPRKVLSEPVGDLSAFRNEIIAAIDFLMTGV
jgi:toxin CcdB